MFSQIKMILVACIVLAAIGSALAVPPTEEELLAVHEAANDALNAHDVDAMMSFWTDDIIYDYVAVPPPAEGKQQVAAFFRAAFQALPDMHVEQRNILVSGNIVVTECTVTGTHLGEWMGIPATGNSLQLIHMDVLEFEGDKMKRMTTYDDSVSFLVQIGVMPATEVDPALLIPSFPLPDAEPTGLAPLEATEESFLRWNSHDLSVYAKMFHPDAEILMAPLGFTLNRDAYMAAKELYLLAFPDLHAQITRSMDMGDGWVISEVVLTGTNVGPYSGLPATRRPVEVRGGILQRFDADGLITNLNVYFDNITLLAQLGLFPPPDPAANKDLVRRYFEEIWHKGNLDLVDEFVSNDCMSHLPEGDFTGIEGVKQHVTTFRSAFPDIHITFDEMIAEGDKVALRWSGRATQTGELMGIPPTGVEVLSTGVTTFQIADGKFVEIWSSADVLGIMQRLGVMPPTRQDYTWGVPSQATGDPGNPAANTALVLYVAQKFWNEQNVAALDNTHSPDAIAHNPVIPGHPLPYNMYKHACLVHLAAFPDLHVTTEHIMAEADNVAIRWSVTGTNLADLMGIPASGREVTWTGSTIYRFADGKIVENWWAYDALGMIQQLTAPPEPDPGQQ